VESAGLRHPRDDSTPPNGTVVGGANTIRFRFNQTDGIVSAYRVLAWNFLTVEGKKLLPPDAFVQDAPETWTPPLPDAASILAGRELWHTASLVASSFPTVIRFRRTVRMSCTRWARPEILNFSTAALWPGPASTAFHPAGEQIASYIRSLPLPNPGRP